MARYITKVRTSRSSADAFGYMADLRNFAEWDPGVSKVVQVEGDVEGHMLSSTSPFALGGAIWFCAIARRSSNRPATYWSSPRPPEWSPRTGCPCVNRTG